MKKDYWLERWKREETGFHQDEINPYLRQYWRELHPVPGSEVFVPLCGKSRDMLWLRKQGHTVLGVEWSAMAVQAFFKENGYTAHHVTGEKFDCYEADGIRILCGDFFDLNKDDLAKAGAVYDRASLVALPPEMRERYVRHLLGILPPAIQILLVTFDYPQPEMEGPPFAVSPGEVEALYHKQAEIRLLAQPDILAQEPRFQKRGLSRLRENIFLLTSQNA
ncbi:thiopurine S-methyltransferase [Nitrosospira sp. Nsp5]|uniref:Thiopurine S-methyltransferase n=1 Tax=Nitrosospira multiformis TaxID=1231 RepID=A0ABY0TGB7_9PROT|nr:MULTISPECIES: thiopurine S-methyltransferase [Nitrosospira]PTR10639.1 thiopurine S-methyltransferase [Nitrosospira sp. Nsp5]SDQ78950.1 thiopurine S-methyltransferase [Nitrosospira multiformis]